MKEILVAFDNETITLTLNSCLICMKNHGEISVARRWMEQPQTLTEMIMDITNVKISNPPDKTFLSNVCLSCAYKIVEFYTFKTEAETANSILINIFNDMKDRSEIESSNEMTVEEIFEPDTNEMIMEKNKEQNLDNEQSKFDDFFESESESSQSESESDDFFPKKQTNARKHKSVRKCYFCDKEFIKYVEFTNHIKTEHPDSLHKCDICAKSFKTRIRLNDHRLIHFKSFCICEICSRKFKSEMSLKTHLLTHGESFNCETCGKVFYEKEKLDNHVRQHKCTICDKTFVKTREYRIHQRIHTGEPIYNCPKCDLSFVNEEFYQIHVRNHDQSGIICKICSRKISSAGRLATHQLKVHLEEGDYLVCMICEEMFTTRDELKNHLFTHNRRLIHKSNQIEQRNIQLKCKYCEERFRSEKPKMIHEREIHTGEKKPECLICHKTFNWQSTLTGHMKNIHNIIK